MKAINVIHASGALKKFLDARASGSASRELLMQLSAESMKELKAEQLAAKLATVYRPSAVVLEFERARREAK